jgi:hypothetical protein
VRIIFVQPWAVSAALASQCGERVAVLDVAFNAGSPAAEGTPQEQYERTTLAFVRTLGPWLVCWVDHHPRAQWAAFKDDDRFLLVPREQAPACPPLITPEVVARYGVIDTLVVWWYMATSMV